MKPAISVHNLSKEYRLGLARTKGNNLTENLRYQSREIWDKVTRLVKPNKAFSKEESFWALKDVSFDVQPGEVVGIIGRNGAGKSTLLKVLSQIAEPSSGHAVVRGRMGSLLEVGTGFHPELTGRENIYMNGAILGMKREEINRKFDEIVAFAEVEKFLDTPVKRYSSGMYVRLAFAVAAHLEPEILIVDEVLAVGDAEFQKKCITKMSEVRRSGHTVLFVSHNMAAVKSLCSRCLLMDKSKLILDADTSTAAERYAEQHKCSVAASIILGDHPNRDPKFSSVMKQATLTSNHEATPRIRMYQTLGIHVDFATSGQAIKPVLGVIIKDQLGGPIFGNNNLVVNKYLFEESVSSGRISCHFDNLPLMPGYYTIDLYLSHLNYCVDVITSAIPFEVAEEDVFGSGKLPPVISGPICLPARWTLQS